MRKIPRKNYIILLIIMVITTLFVFYAKNSIEVYKYNKLNISPLNGIISKVNENEIYLSLAETNQIVLFVRYSDPSVRKIEKELVKNIKNKNINEYVIYYDVTDEKKYLDTLNTEFEELDVKLSKAPMFIYIKNGNALEAIDSSDRMINIEDFNYLIEKYKIGE